MHVYRQTRGALDDSLTCRGIGPLGGRTVKVTIHPDSPDRGICFVRTDDAEEDSVIRADWPNFIGARLGTVLGNQRGVTLLYAEHILDAVTPVWNSKCVY